MYNQDTNRTNMTNNTAPLHKSELMKEVAFLENRKNQIEKVVNKNIKAKNDKDVETKDHSRLESDD